MSETIMLKQFNGSTVTPKDDALMYDLFCGETGLMEGCDLTHIGAGQIRIGEGRGIIKGRQFVVQEHTISVTLSSDSDMQGRVYIKMDLSDMAEPIKILHVTAAELPELEQDENCNYDNGVYEIELGTYTASKLTINSLEKTISLISSKTSKKMIVDNPDTVGVVTEEGYPVGCMALNGLLGGIRFGVDDDGNYGYIKAGADTVTPFKKETKLPNITVQAQIAVKYTESNYTGSVRVFIPSGYKKIALSNASGTIESFYNYGAIASNVNNNGTFTIPAGATNFSIRLKNPWTSGDYTITLTAD